MSVSLAYVSTKVLRFRRLRFIKPNNATVTFTLDKDSLLTVRTDR